jgi:hypothetical protein
MSPQSGLFRVGGFSFMASGVLLFLKYCLDLVARPPPTNGAEILAWASASRWPLAMGIEVQFIGAVLLVPAAGALHASLAGTDRAKAVTGCGLLVAAIPIIAVVEIFQGRLVFPVNGMLVRSPDVAELVVAVMFGGMHVAGILWGVAAIMISLAMWRERQGRRVALLGMAAGFAGFVGSYPWLIGFVPLLVAQVLFSAWFVAVGWRLRGMGPNAVAAP